MEAFRKTNVALILWCLVIAGSYAFSLVTVHETMSREERAVTDLGLFSLSFYALSIVLIIGALLAIFQVNWLWVVIIAVVVKGLMVLSMHFVTEISIWGPFFQAAIVGGLSYLFIHWAKEKQAYQQDETQVEEF